MKRRGLVIAALAVVLFTAAIYYAAATAIHHLSMVVSLFYNNETILRALDQLVYAEVHPPLWLPLVCGLLSVLLIYAAFIRERHGTAAIMMKTAAVFGVLLITVSAYAGTIYLTEVNGVPVHTAGKIIVNVIESGVFG
ncbi:MAG: hypothetical protein ACYCWE_04790 [Eubacteriales bacterium]